MTLSWDEFKHQKAEAKIGAAVHVSLAALADEQEKVIDWALDELAKQIRLGTFKNGYRGKDLPPSLFVSEDPMTPHARFGATLRADLTARPEQFIAHVEDFIRWQGTEIERLSSWRGFLMMKWERLVQRFRPTEAEEWME